MAYLSSRVFPVSSVLDNVTVTKDGNKSRLDVVADVSTLNCAVSCTGMPGSPGLSAMFSDYGTIMYINGTSYNPQTTYLQIRQDSGSLLLEDTKLVFSRMLPANDNFDVTIPYGIAGNPFWVVISDHPISIKLSKSLAFFTINYKQ